MSTSDQTCAMQLKELRAYVKARGLGTAEYDELVDRFVSALDDLGRTRRAEGALTKVPPCCRGLLLALDKLIDPVELLSDADAAALFGLRGRVGNGPG